MTRKTDGVPTRSATSADGTTIVYETHGRGPTLITVAGALCDRALMRSTAEAFGQHFTVVNYDRRGRGSSGDTLPYAVERELEDLAALIEIAGGSADLYGHSSGAGLVLRAVAAGLPVGRFVLHDPPYSPDDKESRAEARVLAGDVRSLLEGGRPAEAVTRWFAGIGMPVEMIDELHGTPRWEELVAWAPSLAHDSAVMGDLESGGAIPSQLARRAGRRGLVLVGEKSPGFMLAVSRRLTALLPDAEQQVLPGADHVAAPEVVAPAVAAFLRRP